LEQAVLTPVFASIPASEKRNIPCTKGAGWKSSFREAQHFVKNIFFSKASMPLQGLTWPQRTNLYLKFSK
jgi:hypothetical protein